FGMRSSMGGEGHEMALITLNGNQAQSRTVWMGASLLLPSPDSRNIYTSEGVFTTQLDKVYPTKGQQEQAMEFVPARHGDIFMRLEPAGDRLGVPGQEQNKPGTISFLLPGQYRPFGTLRDVEGVTAENLAYGGNPANKMHHDKR